MSSQQNPRRSHRIESWTDAVSGRLGGWLPLLLRVLAVTLTLYPAVRKFVQYSARVEAFEGYGMPWPELAVPATGVIEVVAILLIGLGIAGRLGAASLVAGMLVAIVAAGPNPANVLVLVASAGICALGTGPYSYWDPSFAELLGGSDSQFLPVTRSS